MWWNVINTMRYIISLKTLHFVVKSVTVPTLSLHSRCPTKVQDRRVFAPAGGFLMAGAALRLTKHCPTAISSFIRRPEAFLKSYLSEEKLRNTFIKIIAFLL